MALGTQYPGYISIAESPENIEFGTCKIGNDFGEVKSASVKRTADKEELGNCNGALLAAILKNPRFELSLKTLFTLDVSPPGIGERIAFPLVGVTGHILDVSVEWEESGGRMLSIEATRWDSIGGNPQAKYFDGSEWTAITDTVAVTPSTAPTLVSATVAADGDTLTLVFSRAINLGSGSTFTVTDETNGENVPVYTSGSGTTTLVFALPETVQTGDTVTLDFVQPGNGWQGTDGHDVASITDGAVTNNSAI